MSHDKTETTESQLAILADVIEDLYLRMAWHSNRNECYQQIKKLRAAIPKREDAERHD